MKSNAADKPDPSEISALLSDERSILRQTQRAATQFGGIAVFVPFLGKIDFVEVIRKHMPIRWKSANYIEPSSNFTAFLIAILVGARRFAHASLLRGNRTLQSLLGMDRFQRRYDPQLVSRFRHERSPATLRTDWAQGI